MPFANTQFHAVGQGCFYSGEIHCAPESEPLHIVYDCGSETAGDALEREMNLFHQIIRDAPLDALVLSHLDSDHANGLSLLLDNSLIAKNVFLPYLTPLQRVIAVAASPAADEDDPDFFELLADPVGFLQGRGVENVIFINGGADESGNSSEQDFPPNGPAGDNGNSPSLGDLENDRDGKMLFHKNEKSKNTSASSGPLANLSPPTAQPENAKDARPTRTANIHFKTDRKPFHLSRCWQGKFFHRDEMRVVAENLGHTWDFTIRAGDSPSIGRYKRFLADVYGQFGSLDPGRLIMAIRDESERKALRECYHHIQSNHNDVSLVLWHGPIKIPAVVRLASETPVRGPRQRTASSGYNGGTLLTGDLTCTNGVMEKMIRHFGRRMSGSAFLQVPHHGSARSWNAKLLEAANSDIIPVINAGRNNIYRHPHPAVVDSLNNTNGGFHWVLNNERNTVVMNIQTI